MFLALGILIEGLFLQVAVLIRCFGDRLFHYGLISFRITIFGGRRRFISIEVSFFYILFVFKPLCGWPREIICPSL